MGPARGRCCRGRRRRPRSPGRGPPAAGRRRRTVAGCPGGPRAAHTRARRPCRRGEAVRGAGRMSGAGVRPGAVRGRGRDRRGPRVRDGQHPGPGAGDAGAHVGLGVVPPRGRSGAADRRHRAGQGDDGGGVPRRGARAVPRLAATAACARRPGGCSRWCQWCWCSRWCRWRWPWWRRRRSWPCSGGAPPARARSRGRRCRGRARLLPRAPGRTPRPGAYRRRRWRPDAARGGGAGVRRRGPRRCGPLPSSASGPSSTISPSRRPYGDRDLSGRGWPGVRCRGSRPRAARAGSSHGARSPPRPC